MLFIRIRNAINPDIGYYSCWLLLCIINTYVL